MMDFAWKILLAIAVLLSVDMLGDHSRRIEKVEAQVQEVCVSMQHLLSNRPTPAIHSYAKALPICGEKR